MLTNSDMAAALIGRELADDDHRVVLEPTKREWRVTLYARIGRESVTVGLGFTRLSVDAMPPPGVVSFARGKARELAAALQKSIAEARDRASSVTDQKEGLR